MKNEVKAQTFYHGIEFAYYFFVGCVILILNLKNNLVFFTLLLKLNPWISIKTKKSELEE